MAPAIWVMTAHNVQPKLVLGYGVLVFGASVLVKWALTLGVLSRHVYPRLDPGLAGILQGLVSSACEMGFALAALSLWLRDLAFWQVFGFGAGAAAVEALILSLLQNPHAGTANGDFVAGQIAKLNAGPGWVAAGVPFAERAIATTDHIACRGLIAAALASGSIWPIAVAFLAFAATDGLAGYCLGRRWQFADPAVAARLYGGLALIAAGSVVAWRIAL